MPVMSRGLCFYHIYKNRDPLVDPPLSLRPELAPLLGAPRYFSLLLLPPPLPVIPSPPPFAKGACALVTPTGRLWIAGRGWAGGPPLN